MADGLKSSRERYHLNAPGDFYVERDMCIICRAPEHAAPELMAFFENPDGSSRRDDSRGVGGQRVIRPSCRSWTMLAESVSDRYSRVCTMRTSDRFGS